MQILQATRSGSYGELGAMSLCISDVFLPEMMATLTLRASSMRYKSLLFPFRQFRLGWLLIYHSH